MYCCVVRTCARLIFNQLLLIGLNFFRFFVYFWSVLCAVWLRTSFFLFFFPFFPLRLNVSFAQAISHKSNQINTNVAIPSVLWPFFIDLWVVRLPQSVRQSIFPETIDFSPSFVLMTIMMMVTYGPSYSVIFNCDRLVFFFYMLMLLLLMSLEIRSIRNHQSNNQCQLSI